MGEAKKYRFSTCGALVRRDPPTYRFQQRANSCGDLGQV
jgi:hypothetical protein